jgi:pimeloyl-ACP methyl ester carboxylesterase
MTSDINGIRQRTAQVNGITLHLTEAGDPAAPAIVLSHGFPESAYSWRHQMLPLAAAGYHVIAPDQRGYGRSTCPSDVDDYGIVHLTDDLLALLDDTGHDTAIFVGHDWGALIVWEIARMHPARVDAVVGVSVPQVNWPGPPTQMLRAIFGDRFFYMLYFQQVGPAEAELGADPYDTMARVLWSASGEGFSGMPAEMPPAEGTGFLTTMKTKDIPPRPWSWLTEDDLQRYAEDFATSGFFGPVSYYRNLDANYEIVKDLGLDRYTMPSFFIGGDNDPVLVNDSGAIDRMRDTLPDFRGGVLIPGAGHWTQQEKPAEFNDALTGFLRTL